MPRCCQGQMPPAVVEGRHIRTTGAGTPQDPLVVSATTALDAVDNAIFNVILEGEGTLESPWRIQINWAAGASLSDLPDVMADDPPDGYVLTWNPAISRWVPGPPNQVTSGAVLVGDGLQGDGSAGGPLEVEPDPARFIQVTPAGVGLNNAGINSLIRAFPNAAARDLADPPPAESTLSILATRPDVIDRWDGGQWLPVTGGRSSDIQPGQLLSLSGAYSGGSTTTYVAQLSFTTDSTGAFVVIPAGDLSGYSGVLDCVVQETGDVPWHCLVKAGSNNIVATARRLDGGAPMTSTPLTGTVRAILY